MKIFSIIGPTGVGKTSFALELAWKILQNKSYTGIDLISADSRQVYQGLEIISGADIPLEFKLNHDQNLIYPFYTNGQVNLHGVSIIAPDQEWSVTHFQDLAWEVIKLAKQKQRLVMVIGGTGLYHDQLLNIDPVLRVKPDNQVRQEAKFLELEALQIWAQKVNPVRYELLNHSDQNNPRRLIRVIEIGHKNLDKKTDNSFLKLEQIYIGLHQDLVLIEAKIKNRVLERFSNGAIQEVRRLQKKYANWSLPAFSALGTSELSQYLNGLFSKDECVALWTLHELQYAKRQLTWWKNRDVFWFEIGNHEWKLQAFTYILSIC
ncbi:hypothetical protein KJ707_01330 [Patescibacteria group bacterium]|nr:hypothetical protein [Patescibacteria group bacterium]MBU1967094.1 hypothetical protein [Patescibacteria group bacterium]MBU2543195.1 hypothetical protein [Patescibacteria group bacterium]